MYKVGDKVETPHGTGIISLISEFPDDKGNNVYCVRTEETIKVTHHLIESDIRPYVSAHDKLLAMGWERVDDTSTYSVYKKVILKNAYHDDYIQLDVIKRTKVVGGMTYYNDNFSSQHSHHQYSFGLELLRILTQLLEEME